MSRPSCRAPIGLLGIYELMRPGLTAMRERRSLFAAALFLSYPGAERVPHGPTHPRATSAPLDRLLAISLRTKEMQQVHKSAVRGSALTPVPECDMRRLAAGFVFVISTASAISWPVRSVAGHGWFGSDHHWRSPKPQIPNPKSQTPIRARETRSPPRNLRSRLRVLCASVVRNRWSLGFWDLGFGIWDLGFGICYRLKTTRRSRRPDATVRGSC